MPQDKEIHLQDCAIKVVSSQGEGGSLRPYILEAIIKFINLLLLSHFQVCDYVCNIRDLSKTYNIIIYLCLTQDLRVVVMATKK